MDKRIAGIIMFLPCIDGAWDRSRWGDWIYEAAKRNRYREPSIDPKVVKFWPLTDDEAAGKASSVLSGEYVREWSECARKMAAQGDNTFTGQLTARSFWSDFNTRPLDYFDRIAPTPVLWTMATEDVVCGPLEWTKSEYGKLKGPKDLCVLEGEHLPQYFDPGFPKSVDAMLAFLKKYATTTEVQIR
jgi:hypothetical protein